MDEIKKTALSKETSDAITEMITKIAVENDIAMADKVIIQLSAEDGIIRFAGVEETEG